MYHVNYVYHVFVLPVYLYFLQVKGSWAGYYDYNTFDQNLVIGNHPVIANFFFANGSSGHGIQHAIPIGRAISELLYDGGYQTIDLSRLSFDRLYKEEPLYEVNVV